MNLRLGGLDYFQVKRVLCSFLFLLFLAISMELFACGGVLQAGLFIRSRPLFFLYDFLFLTAIFTLITFSTRETTALPFVASAVIASLMGLAIQAIVMYATAVERTTDSVSFWESLSGMIKTQPVMVTILIVLTVAVIFIAVVFSRIADFVGRTRRTRIVYSTISGCLLVLLLVANYVYTRQASYPEVTLSAEKVGPFFFLISRLFI